MYGEKKKINPHLLVEFFPCWQMSSDDAVRMFTQFLCLPKSKKHNRFTLDIYNMSNHIYHPNFKVCNIQNLKDAYLEVCYVLKFAFQKVYLMRGIECCCHWCPHLMYIILARMLKLSDSDGVIAQMDTMREEGKTFVKWTSEESTLQIDSF